MYADVYSKGDQGTLKVRAPKASWLSIDPITDSANRAEESCQILFLRTFVLAKEFRS
jgi:hypothetical protein